MDKRIEAFLADVLALERLVRAEVCQELRAAWHDFKDLAHRKAN
jgi:hypothetical protein